VSWTFPAGAREMSQSAFWKNAGGLTRIIREAPACVVLYDSFGENVLASVL
jgi:hypothetical protein